MSDANNEVAKHVRILTDDDIEAIAILLQNHHKCKFSDEEQVDIRRYIKRLNSLANAIGWAVLGIIGAGLLYLFKLGVLAKGN